MYRIFVGPTTCCLLLSWGVLAAPRKDDPWVSFHRTSTVGDKAIYESNDGQQSWESVDEVTDVRRTGAALIVTVRAIEGDRAPKSYRFQVSDKGVYLVGEGDAALESPECYLRFPLKKGDTWETAHKLDGETYPTKHTIAGEEEVEVPAGTFRCIRIESEFVFSGLSYTRTRWRAPRCGIVKEVVEGKDGERTVYVRTDVLKSFTPGRE